MTTFNTVGYTAKSRNPLYSGGKMLRCVHAELFVDASELTDGDVFVLARNLPVGARIHRIMSPNATPALTAAADNDLGFYKENSEGVLVAIDADILVDGGDLSSALSTRDLLNNLNTSLDQTATIGDLLSLQADTAPTGGVFLCMTMNTKSTADGTLDLDVVIEMPTTN